MTFSGDADEEERHLDLKIKSVRSALQALIHHGLRGRRHVFW
jgi:hypothetical protein